MADTPDVAVFKYLYQLILKFGKKAPAWLQAFVFFLFVMFFLYTSFRFIGGDFAVRGRFTTQVIDETGRPKKAYASGLEVCLDDRMFATNSLGMFYAVLTPRQYYAVVASGELKVNLGRAEQPLGEVTLEYERGSSAFREKFLDPQLLAEVRATPSPSFFEIVPAAYADDDAPPSSSNRLFVEEIQLDGRASYVKTVELELEAGGKEYDLRSVIGGEVNELPLTTGIPYRLGNSYFFPIAPAMRPNTRLKIELQSDMRFFSKYEEEFIFALPATYGSFLRRGTGSISTIRMLYLSPVDFVLSPALDKSRVSRMRGSLERAGIRVVESAPMKSATPDLSNVLYIDRNVPSNAAVAALRAIRESGTPLHAIHYSLNPARKPLRPYEMQLVTDSTPRPALSAAQIDSLLAARSQADLARQVASLAPAPR